MTLIKVDILEKKKEIYVDCRLRVKTDLKLLLNIFTLFDNNQHGLETLYLFAYHFHVEWQITKKMYLSMSQI